MTIVIPRITRRKYAGAFTIVTTVERLDEIMKEKEFPALYRVARAWIEAGDRARVGCGKRLGAVERIFGRRKPGQFG